ncbi:hypothetical protein [Glaciihabitans sp. UYNi722]|uniref:hypothetical protein n=1 Tax=Glaciihabitans sp. UYNi722 TaxID=3156344 RepID=UPI00339A16ED
MVLGILAVIFLIVAPVSLVGFGTAFDGFSSANFFFVVFLLVELAVVCFLVMIGVRTVRAEIPSARTWTRWLRLSRFASANQLQFSPLDPNPGYPGQIFDDGDHRFAYDHLSRRGGRFFDMGNYRYITGSGRSRTNHGWGYLAIKLDRRLPNMVLDARSNNNLLGGTNLPDALKRDQSLSLEGDFDKDFTLYCPREYKTDALCVFTPDLMALLIDQTQQFDVEIVDDWMFVYSSKPLNMGDVPTLNHLFRIIDTVGAVDTVGAKTLSQTERYADERMSDRAVNMVAPQGRRLKKTFPMITVIFLVAYGAFWIWNAFH